MRERLFRGLHAEHWRALLVKLGWPPLSAMAMAQFLTGEQVLPPLLSEVDAERWQGLADYGKPKEKLS